MTIRSRTKRRVVLVIVSALAVTGALGAARAIAFALRHESANWLSADVTADWVVTKGAWSGHDPYGDTTTLAHQLGTPIVDRAQLGGANAEAPHPRPPGAFVVLAPLVLLAARDAYTASAIANLILLGVLALMIAGATQRPLGWVLAGIGVALNAGPARDALLWGTLSYVIAVLVLATFLGARRGDRARAGIPLGIAAALKLFPLALVVPLFLLARRRIGVGATATFATLSAAGLLLPSVHATRAMHALVGAGGAWLGSPFNSSLAGAAVHIGLARSSATVLAVAVGAVGVWLLCVRSTDFTIAYWGTAIVALLVSPISWRHYDVAIAVGAVLILVANPPRPAKIVIGAWVVANVSALGIFAAQLNPPWEQHHFGAVGVVQRLGLLAGFVLASRRAAGTVPEAVVEPGFGGIERYPVARAFAAAAGD